MFSNNVLVEVYDELDGMKRDKISKKGPIKKKIIVDIPPHRYFDNQKP